VAGVILIGFGVVYGLWGLHRTMRSRWHEHGHGHTHWHGGSPAAHVHAHPDDRRMTPGLLFLVFSADPCIAVIPLMFAAVPLGWGRTLAVVAAYEIATIGTMVTLVLPARAAATAVRSTWADRYADAFAGGVIAAVGVAVVSFGL
jgi:hypothetical protein